MRLTSFSVPGVTGAQTRIGCVREDGTTIDLNLGYRRLLARQHGLPEGAAARIADAVVPTDMRSFIENGSPALDAARLVLAGPEGDPGAAGAAVAAGVMTPLAPLPAPPLIRDFMAFEEHLNNIYPRLGREIPPGWYEMPVYYKGNPASVGGPGDVVRIPGYADDLDFEFEFAAVIGRGGADIRAEDALAHVFGFMIYNDFSARGIQQRETAVGLGPAKGKDFHGAHVFGPWLVTADEIPDVYDLTMRAELNGELWCESSTATMHWRFEDMIAHASRDEALQPGEIFGSGTVGGGSALERGSSLRAGDRVALSVQGLGTLRNEVGAAKNR
jgi:2-keto-4-pentenoate hydratase/2-oxohepta-3-ene-1,7-dioic acid hydratase in catechol pathway